MGWDLGSKDRDLGDNEQETSKKQKSGTAKLVSSFASRNERHEFLVSSSFSVFFETRRN